MKKRLYRALLSLVLSVSVITSGFFVSTPQITYAQEATVTDSEYSLAENVQDGVILHCFDWTYQQIIDELPNIAKAGFSSVQTSPAQVAVKGNSIWYYLYQPNGFYVADSGLGSEEDLKRLCKEADKYDVKVVVDVVANHLAGDHSNIDWELKNSQYWHNAGSKIDYSNRWQITHGDIGMPDINSENDFVQQKVKNYIQQLKKDGVDGIRWDAAKHIGLPSEGCNFWNTVIDKSMYNYGEILVGAIDQHNVDQRTQDNINKMKEYTSYMSVTDSSYGSDILNAVKSGRVPSGYGSWVVSGLDEHKLVYWAESHDTYANDGGESKYVDQNKIDRAYAIAASRNGASALYFSRPSQTEKTKIMVGEKGSTHFKSAEVAAVNHFHNACIGEKDYYTTSSDQSVAAITRNSGACIVLGNGGNRDVTIANGGSLTTPGTYYDEITGNKFVVTKDKITGKVGSTGIAAFYQSNKKVSVSADKESGTTFTDKLKVKFTANNATKSTLTINGKTESFTGSVTKTFDATTTVKVYAENSKGSAAKTYTYTKNSQPPVRETRDIYLDVNNCSWFGSDLAVAAIKTNLDSAFTKMTKTTVTDTNKTVYTVKVSTKATSATIVRMLPSGKYYNAKTITLNSAYNRYTSDGNWSNVTTDIYTAGGGGGNYNTDVSVYFTNNYNWNNVYAYSWGGSGKRAQWPGEKMTYVGQNEYNQAVYTIKVASDSKGLIFNNGSGSQTVDITSNIKENTGFYISGNSGSKCNVGTYTYNK